MDGAAGRNQRRAPGRGPQRSVTESWLKRLSFRGRAADGGFIVKSPRSSDGLDFGLGPAALNHRRRTRRASLGRVLIEFQWATELGGGPIVAM